MGIEFVFNTNAKKGSPETGLPEIFSINGI
jgi:hypothetical protein